MQYYRSGSVRQEDRAVGAASSAPVPELSGSRVLALASDEGSVIRQALLLDGLVAKFASTPQSFARMQGTLGKFDLLILDASLPNRASFDLCSQVRKEYPPFNLPILMLTSRHRPEDAALALAAGANDTLADPADPAELRTRVRQLLYMKASVAEFVRMEVAFLHARIRPHFLFNTLNSIAALSEEDHSVMRLLLERFGAYLRESFRTENLERLIPLHREMQLVQSYLEIEKIRFNDRLHTMLAIGDDVSNVLIPPLSIQSLVENAVRHGLMARKRGGNLSVRARAKDGDCSVLVEDDGVGMTQAASAWYAQGSDSREGGLAMTDRRLRMAYGARLNIVSNPAFGTRISFEIPLSGGILP